VKRNYTHDKDTSGDPSANASAELACAMQEETSSQLKGLRLKFQQTWSAQMLSNIGTSSG
jgi:hypothetical protein